MGDENFIMDLIRRIEEIRVRLESEAAPRVCQVCRSINHFGCICPNLQQVILATSYIEDPFYTTDVYQEPAHLKEQSQEKVHTEECLNAEPTEEAIVPILPLVEVMPIPIEIPTPPSFYVKAIPYDLVKDSLVFKSGVLAKWHVDEVIDTTPPPLYTEVKVEILFFVYGGEGVKGGHSSWKKKSLDEGSMLAMCFNQCCPKRRLLNEWVEGWSVHSGRFKLLG